MLHSLVLPLAGGAGRSLLSPCADNSCSSLGMSGGMPLCFPNCGRLSHQGQAGVYRYQGQDYRLPIHGFAHQCAFSVIDERANQVTLVLLANEQTYRAYPFQFKLTLSYTLWADRLCVGLRVCNQDDVPMPYSFGFHPYFLLAYQTRMDTQLMMNSDHRSIYNDALTEVIAEEPPFAWPLLVGDASIQESLNHIRAPGGINLRYSNGDRLRMSWVASSGVSCSYVQVYAPQAEDFVCIEPWMAPPNALNTGQGLRYLPPGEEDVFLLVLAG